MRSRFRAVLAVAALLAGLPALAISQVEPPKAEPSSAPRASLESTPAKPAPAQRLAVPASARPTATPAPKPPSGPPPEHLAVGQPLPAAELGAYVDGLVTEAMQRDHIAGVTVSVVQNGQVLLKKGYGFASLSPARAVDPDRTLFRIGSISKTFTWIAVMKEVEAGRMRLDQPVNLYLPEKSQVRDQGFDQPIRVINLMDHSPGFEDRALGQLFEDDFDRVRPLDVYLRQERPKRVRAPGLVSSYSNYGAALAGEAASWTAGRPYERLIEDEILGPARMSHTTFREPHPPKPGLPAPMPEALVPDVSDAFRWNGVGFQKRGYEYIEQVAPAGAASSTAADMARYMLLQLNGGTLDGPTIYGPATASAFRTPIRRAPPGFNGWAHGFAVYALPGGRRGYGHDGATLSFFSNMVVIPDLNLGLFISTNTDSGARLAGRFPEDVVRQFYAKPEVFPRSGSRELAEEGGLYAGHYLSTRRPYSGLERFVMQLAVAGAQARVSPDGKLIVSNTAGAVAYVPEGPLSDGRFVSDRDERRIAFIVKDGRAIAFLPASNGALFERVSMWQQPSTLAFLAALTALAALATLAGLAFRSRRDLRQSVVQSRAGIVQNIQAGLWLAAMALFGMFATKAAGDTAWVMYGWPSPLIILASACALVAAALTVLTLLALPAVWAGGRRLDSWSLARKAAFTLTVLIYAGFTVLLGAWGALSPWSG